MSFSSLLTLFFIFIILIILSAFFSGSEIGMMSLNRYRLKHLVKKQNKKAIRVNNLLQRPDKLLSIVLIGNTIANILASMVATIIGQRLYGDWGVAVAAFLLTLLVLVFAEMVPKTFAALHPIRIAFAVARPLKWMQILFAPIIFLVSFMSNNFLRLFGVSLEKSQREALTSEELRSVVNEAEVLLSHADKNMLISLLDLVDATVEDIMIPKAEIVGLNIESTWQELLYQLETIQHTRLALYRGRVEDLLGLVHIREVFNLKLNGKLDRENLIRIADKPYFIPEGTPLNTQILNFQKMKERSCFVVNEYGDLQGLVTLEDILEEVIGEFTTDIANLSKNIVQQGDKSIIVDAAITLRHLNRLKKWQLPNIGPRTLSGLIIEYLGYIPPADCCLRINRYQIEILKVSDNKIKSVRMRKLPKASG